MTETINPSLSPKIATVISLDNLKPFAAQKIVKNNVLVFPLLLIMLIASLFFYWGSDIADKYMSDGMKVFLSILWIFVMLFVSFQTWNMCSEYKKFDFLWAKSKASMKGNLYISKNGKFGLLKRRISLGGPYFAVVLMPEYDDIECLVYGKQYKITKGIETYLFNADEGVIVKE